MDVTNQFPEIDVFLADDGFIAVLPPACKPYGLEAASERKSCPCRLYRRLKLTTYPVKSLLIRVESPAPPDRKRKWAWLDRKAQA